jgi:D-inositol-3-phosphate glycosyltransferase
MVPRKGVDTVIEAFALLGERHGWSRGRLVVVGGESGTGRRSGHRLDELAARLGISELIDFRAPMPAAQLAQMYRAADVVAVPSYNESFGLVALEAQAAGTPVVAAAVGGLTVAVAGGVSGLLVDGHDPQTWADALASVVLDPPVRARLAAAAPRHAALFSWDVTVDGLLESYARALRGGRNLEQPPREPAHPPIDPQLLRSAHR